MSSRNCGIGWSDWSRSRRSTMLPKSNQRKQSFQRDYPSSSRASNDFLAWLGSPDDDLSRIWTRTDHQRLRHGHALGRALMPPAVLEAFVAAATETVPLE